MQSAGTLFLSDYETQDKRNLSLVLYIAVSFIRFYIIRSWDL